MTEITKDPKLAMGNRLKEARKLAGLSQNQVASIINISRPSVSEIESGRRQVSADELSRFCDVYDVETDWVLGKPKSTDSKDNPRLELAARAFSKLDPEELERLMQVFEMVKTDKE